jgi:hypothetical protein
MTPAILPGTPSECVPLGRTAAAGTTTVAARPLFELVRAILRTCKSLKN